MHATTFLLRFLCLGALALALESLLWTQPYLSTPLLHALAQAAAWVASGFGAAPVTEGAHIFNPVGVTVIVAPVCSTEDIMLLVWAAALAFPATWRQRARAMSAAFILLPLLNVLRLGTLVWASQFKPEWFDWLHLRAGGLLLTLSALTLFLAWAAWVKIPKYEAVHAEPSGHA